MPEIRQLYFIDNSYSETSSESEYIYLGNAASIQFIVFSDSYGHVALDWSADGVTNTKTVIHTLESNVACEISSPIFGRFCRFRVYDLTSPCILQQEGFFF